jgi:hypothetical protein
MSNCDRNPASAKNGGGNMTNTEYLILAWNAARGQRDMEEAV